MNQFSYSHTIKVAVILPSRGLMFSKTAEEIMDNLYGVRHKFFFAHKLPIPECFETPTRAALADPDITHLWFVEDDMILPPNALQDLLDADKHAIACDYPVAKDGQGACLTDGHGTCVFSGTGCLLVKREVFKDLKKPYWTDRVRWQVNNYKDHIRFVSTKTGALSVYGLHDVTFGIRLFTKGQPIELSDIKLGQRKLIKLGEAGTNEGAHQIEEWADVVNNYYYNVVRSWPALPQGDLVTVETPTGEVMTSKNHAKTLIDKGLAKKTRRRWILIDDSAGLL